MELGEPDASTPKANPCNALHLSPSALPVVSPQPLEISNTVARCDGLDDRDLADDLEVHCAIVPSRERSRWSRMTKCFSGAERGVVGRAKRGRCKRGLGGNEVLLSVPPPQYQQRT